MAVPDPDVDADPDVAGPEEPDGFVLAELSGGDDGGCVVLLDECEVLAAGEVLGAGFDDVLGCAGAWLCVVVGTTPTMVGVAFAAGRTRR